MKRRVKGGGGGGWWRWKGVKGWRGSVVPRSLQQLVQLALFELRIVSDFVECVRLHDIPVLEDCVQQVLGEERERRGEERKGGGQC